MTAPTLLRQEYFPWKQFIRSLVIIALPVAFQNLVSTTASMIDTIMLGSLGKMTVGAIGLCAQFSSLMFSGYWGFIGGGMMFFAQFWGAGDDKGIQRSYGIMLTFLGIVALIFTSAALFFPHSVMALYTDKAEIQAIGVPYLSLVGFAYPVQILCMGICALLRSIERVKIPLYAGISSVIANCVCNYLFIFGKCGFPQMGARGAAVGTIVSAWINLGVLAFFILRLKIPYVFAIKEHFCWSKDLMKEFLHKSFPIICNELAMGVGNMMINIILGRQSAEAIAAVAVFRVFEGAIIAFFSGFSNAASILVGKEVGAGNHEVALARGKRLIYLASAFTGIVCICLIIIHKPLLHAMSLSGESYTIGTWMLVIFSFIAIIRMGNWCSNDTYRAAGNSGYGSTLEIVFMFALVQPVIYSANFIFHVPFLLLFALCYCDEPIRYVLMQKRLYSGKWIKPVSAAGKATLEAFHKQHNIR